MARKMALIPAEMALQSSMQQHLPSGPILNQLSSLDQQMKYILEDSTHGPESKLNQYYNVLRRYDTMQDNATRIPVPVKIEGMKIPTETNTTQQPTELETLPMSENEILETVPKNQRNTVKILLKYIRENPSISWNRAKELVHNGQRIPGSNFIDLVLDIMKNRKNQVPAAGWEDFTNALIRENVPQGAIGNTQRWQYIMNQLRPLDTSTPIQQPRSRRKRRQPSLHETDDEENDFATPGTAAGLSFIPSPSAIRQKTPIGRTTRSSAKQKRSTRNKQQRSRYDNLY